MKKTNSFPEDEESDEQEFRMDELSEGIFDELSEEFSEVDSQELITRLQSRIETLERRLGGLEEKSSSGGMQSGRVLDEYHRFIDQGREMAQKMLEQKNNDNLTYKTIRIVVRGTKSMNIEYGVKERYRKGHNPSFEDTEILKVPKTIKKALRGQEES